MRHLEPAITILLLLATPLPAVAAEPKNEVVLKKAFVTKFKDRTSIEAKMIVRHSHKGANPVGEGSEDGDLHFSGESTNIGLPFVAEVVNARQQGDAVKFIRDTAEFNKVHPNGMVSIKVLGAWRLWFEHPSKSQLQGGGNPFHPNNTNPDHSFEIHPVATVGTFDVHGSFAPISDKTVHPPNAFVAYPPDVAFPYFDKVEILVKASNSAVTIRCKRIVYNYVQFVMELTQKPKKVIDGYIVLARVTNDGGESESDDEHRMIFVEGTDGAKAMSTAKSGDVFHVLGVPRIDLSAISSLVTANGTKQFSAKLPYEMIIVGIYPE